MKWDFFHATFWSRRFESFRFLSVWNMIFPLSPSPTTIRKSVCPYLFARIVLCFTGSCGVGQTCIWTLRKVRKLFRGVASTVRSGTVPALFPASIPASFHRPIRSIIFSSEKEFFFVAVIIYIKQFFCFRSAYAHFQENAHVLPLQLWEENSFQ